MADIAGMNRLVQRLASLKQTRQENIRQGREGVRAFLAGRRESRRHLARTLAEKLGEDRRRLRERTARILGRCCQERMTVRRMWLAVAGRKRPA